MGLLKLPDEVLQIAFKELLPPFRSESLAEIFVFTIPLDLLVTRLVCRRFHRIATPFAWRRSQLQIATHAGKLHGYVDGASVKFSTNQNKHSLCPLARCRFFDENPHLATHVRVLLVSIEWHAEHADHAREALRAATRAMISLRTVFVWDADLLPFPDIRALLQRPMLRAVRLMDVDGSAFPVRGSWGTGLKMLHIANSICPARLVASAAATLECVIIELSRTCPIIQPTLTLRDMPWTTLKEVALVDCVNEDDWLFFLEGFQRYKQLDLPTPLTELLIGDLGGLEPTRVSQLLQTFGGHPLRRLSLYHVVLLNVSVLGEIVSAFPALFELTVLTEGELVEWPGALDSYAHNLARLPHLVNLAWNNFAFESAADVALFPSLDESALGALYEEHARSLMRHMRSLQNVKLTSITDGIVDTVRVGTWEKIGTVEVTRSTDCVAIHTSSWSTSSGAFADI